MRRAIPAGLMWLRHLQPTKGADKHWYIGSVGRELQMNLDLYAMRAIEKLKLWWIIGQAGDGDDPEAGEDQDNLPACFNGVDDDGDGLADIPNDPGCTSRGDNDETDLAISPQCSNGRDDDGDGLRDYPEDDGCDFAGDRTE